MAYSAIKHYFKFETQELINILIVSFIMSFIISFNNWGGEKLNINYGISYFLIYFVVSLLVIFAYIASQKLYGLHLGINVEFILSKWAALFSLLIAFFSNGRFWVFLFGDSKVSHIASHRIGHQRYELDNKEHSFILLAGNVGLILLAILFKFFSYIPNANQELILNVMLIILAFNFYSMLPLPSSNGLFMMFTSRLLYIFSFGLIIFISFFLIYFGIITSLILSILFASITLWAYSNYIESKIK